MKRITTLLCIFCVIFTLVLSGCGKTSAPSGASGSSAVSESVGASDSSEDAVQVIALRDDVQIRDVEAAQHDFTQYFEITVNGSKIDVLPSYIDASRVSPKAGAYVVTCNYGGKSASIAVVVTETEFKLTLSSAEVTVKINEVLSYDFKALFTATMDGVAVNISDDMVTTDVKAEIGDYEYTVEFYGCSETLTVHVVPENDVEIVESYTRLEMAMSELEDFDLTALFSLYVDGEAVKVTEDMIDASALRGAAVGGSYEVKMSYAVGATKVSAAVTIVVVEERELIITAKNIVTYPNAEQVDLTSLFTITKGGEVIPVTIDMIDGTIDYSSEGVNLITCEYGGKSATAEITVKRGVVINYAKSDVVTVKKGTNKATYNFAGDFIVNVNGARFTRISDDCFDTSAVNFDLAGSYEASINIKYNASTFWGTPNFETVSLTITYVVTENTYTLAVRDEVVVLDAGETDYDVTKNLLVSVNGGDRALVTDKSLEGRLAVYVEQKTPIDYSSTELQTITVAVYVDGSANPPALISFGVRIDSGVEITAADRAVFTGATLYTRDLFTITERGEAVEASPSMIRGKVDTFTPGVYSVTAEYKGVSAVSTVIVYTRDMIGRYKTLLTTIPVKEEEGDDGEYGDIGWGDEGGEYYALAAAPTAETADAGTTILSDLVISEDGSITFNGLTVYSATGVDERTMILRTGSEGNGRAYTLYYDDGKVALDVDNSIMLGFSDYARPLVYFKEDLWSVEEKFTVNYGSNHVLEDSTTNNYSLDCFRIKSKADDREEWYGLLVNLVERTSGDTVYSVKWGGVEFADGFTGEVGESSSALFGKDSYKFTVQSAGVGKIDRETDDKSYAGKTYTGEIDGEAATITFTGSEWLQVYLGSGSAQRKALEIVPMTDYSNMKNGGKLSGNRIFVYAQERDDEWGEYSYTFEFDDASGTFTVLPRDAYYGRYICGNISIFVDGYGTGHMNFNVSSHVTTLFTYSVKNNEMEIRFVGTSPRFEYGESATFYIAPLLNVLTVKSSYGDKLSGKSFENQIITDGAIVRVGTEIIAGDSDSIAKEQLRNAITIITKDGVLSGTAKNNAVILNTVAGTTAGFYQFAVRVTVGGETVDSYYAVQVLDKRYENEPLARAYGAGVINSSLGLVLDKFGRGSVTINGVTYSGTATITDGSFVVKAYSDDGAFISAVGETVADGVVKLTVSGAFNASDYFTSGTHRAVGTSGLVLREFNVGGTLTYVLASSVHDLGEKVTVELVEASTYKITSADGTETFVEITNWGDTDGGLRIVEAPAS